MNDREQRIPDPDAIGTHAIDRIAHARHQQALAALSLHTRTQLHNRLQAALAAGPDRSRTLRMPAWSWATAAALVLALAFGAPWRNLQQSPSAAAASLAAAAAADDAPVAGSALATLDQDPDFYLWLASRDAIALASE
jgi:hypothetical protein